MFRRRLMFGAAVLAAGAWLTIAAETAAAGGYYNLPGSFCQCFGYGYGAGYHACLVLGPSTPCSRVAPNEVRLPYSPGPPYGCYDGGNWGYDYGRPAVAEPSQLPMYGPPAAPTPAAMRPQILR